LKKEERKQDLLKIIENLDISPSLYKNACDKYKSLAEYLNRHGLDADIYPQGSFALGTVIRPYAKDEEKDYDLDFICQVSCTREEITPSELRSQISDILNSSDLYGGKLFEYDECFTIKYADIGGIGFSIDIVPAAAETELNKRELRIMSSNPDLIETAIAIPRHSQQKVYNWITNNPLGYRTWFDEINEPFSMISSPVYRQSLFQAYPTVYASIEEIPVEMERTAMQRVIQILKYHRDVYFSRVHNGDELKPISAIINTIVTEIAKTANPYSSVFELLKYVLDEMVIYSQHLKLSASDFTRIYGERNVFNKSEGKWVIQNPANPKDNLANKWNSNPAIPQRFFQWVNTARKQLIDSLELSDEDFRAHAEAAFGYNTVSKVWKDKYNNVKPKPISTSNPVRPWCNK